MDGILDVYNRFFQPKHTHRLSHPPRLVPINRLRTPLRHRAKSASPRADIAQQHERRSLVIPAFANIRTLRRLAYRMQSESARQLLEIVKVIADRSFSAKPLRLWLPDKRTKLDLHELRRSCHRLLQF